MIEDPRGRIDYDETALDIGDPRESIVSRKLRTFLTVTAVSSLAGIGVAWAECGVAGGDWRVGSKIYYQTCITCHGESGQGAVAGAPDFRAGVLSYPASTLMEHITNGFR